MKRKAGNSRAFTGDLRKIGEVSAMYGLSPETLRFIEKNGLVTPTFNADNTYRVYGQENMVELYQYIAYRNIGFSVKDIAALRTEASEQKLTQILDSRHEELTRELRIHRLLTDRIRELSARIRFAEDNEGMFWFDHLAPGQFERFVDPESMCYSEAAISWRKQAPFAQLPS